jgi:ankyrin repeat protein
MRTFPPIILLLLSVLISLVSSADPVITNATPEFAEFITACTDGRLEEVTKALEPHPNWVHESGLTGETCLHVAGMHGHPEISLLLLQNGADPNMLSRVMEDPEEEHHIHMHALSWHILGAHLESAKLLLAHGANPNQPMDSIMQKGEKVTILDMLEELLAEEDPKIPELGIFQEMRDLLLEHGALHHEEL